MKTIKIIIISICLFGYNLHLNAQDIRKDVIKIDDLQDAKSDSDGTQNGSSIFLGIKAGEKDDSSNNRNIGIGFHSLRSNQNGVSNIGIGNYALQKSSDNRNIGIGDMALSNNLTGNNNIAIGTNAGHFFQGKTVNSSLNNSIFIGTAAKAYSSTDINEIVIGDQVIGNGSNSITLGNDKNQKTILTGNVGIGLKSPKQKLDIVGNMRLINGFGNVKVILDGGKGNSEVTYQKNGKYRGAVGYNVDQDYLYLYQGGNVKIKNGSIKVDKDFLYTNTKQYTAQIPSIAFRKHDLLDKDRINFSDNGIGFVSGLTSSGNNAIELMAPVSLPQGAKIVKFRLVSSAANTLFDAQLITRKGLSRKKNIIAKIVSSGTYDVRENQAVANGEIVDNTHNHYFVVVKIVYPNEQDFADFFGVFVDYTLDKVSQ